jgi:hypothetical protein
VRSNFPKDPAALDDDENDDEGKASAASLVSSSTPNPNVGAMLV